MADAASYADTTENAYATEIYRMAYLSNESIELYDELSRRGYAQEFCVLISRELRTTWTANRMLGYLRYCKDIKEEDIVDEMLGILEDRERIWRKKEMEYFQAKLNEIYYNW